MSRPKRTTPWIARRGSADNGTFYAFWYDAAERKTKRVSLHTTDSAEAETRFAEFLLAGREIRQPRPRGLTVEQALDDYLSEHVDKNCADSGRQRFAIAHLKAFFGDRPLSAVDVPLSRAYTAARMAGEIGGGVRRANKAGSSSTIRRELNVLVAAANHALWMKRTTDKVSVDLPAEKRLGQDDEAPYYTETELARIFDKAAEMDTSRMMDDQRSRPDVERFVRLLYLTGARRRSIEDLSRSQVKLSQRRIMLQKAGKRATRKRQPIVPILSTMEPVLKALLDEGGAERLFEQADYYRQYRAVCKAAGIDDARSHPHVMRHTRATHLLQAGKSLYDVAKLLGDTIATVERVYGHHSHEHLAASLEG